MNSDQITGFCLCHRFVPAASHGQLCHGRTDGDQQHGRLDIFAMRDREPFIWLREEEVEPSGCRHSRQQAGDTLSIRCNSYDDGDEQQDCDGARQRRPKGNQRRGNCERQCYRSDRHDPIPKAA